MNYAGFWRRYAASVIDGFILAIPSLVFAGVFRNPFFSFGGGLIIGFLYRPFFESSALRGTPGKDLMGIMVVSENGETLTFKQACVRFFCSYISIAILFIGYFMQPFTKRRQTLHDMIAEAVVIRREIPEDINYFTAWKSEFKKVVDRL